MKTRIFSNLFFISQFLFILSVIGFSSAHAQIQWRPISEQELQMTAPKVEPDADAEAIFWEVKLDDKKRDKLFYNHYVRVKIFTERGRERFSKFDIPFSKGKTVEDVAARVIKPDGSITELQPSDIFEREILKQGKISVKAKSFAVPGIMPGVIVEYQYKETFKNDSLNDERLIFQRDIPMQKVTYLVRPYKGESLNVRAKNMPELNFVEAGDNFLSVTRENIPAFKEEPQMPPDEEVRQWAQLRYFGYNFSWRSFGNAWSTIFEEATRPDKDIQIKADELTATVTDEEEKLKKIYEFTQTRIRNVTFDQSLTPQQKENIENKKASDTLKRGMGHALHIDLLFAALARGAGFNVALLFAGDRSENFFNPELHTNLSYIHGAGVAVSTSQGLRFFSPSTPFMPFGSIDWYEEGVSALLVGNGSQRWFKTPLSSHEKNVSKRTAKFKLSEDGTLEGFVRVEHHGHQGTVRRRDLYPRTPAEREDILKKAWLETVPTAEISAVSIENFIDSSKPYIYSFNIRVPNYAQKTGKRLFLQPNFFDYGTPPLFSSATRKYPIYFDFPWSEDDRIEIELPKDFEPDNLISPDEVRESKGLGGLVLKIDHEKQTNLLKVERRFFFGQDGRLLFPSGAYQPLKTLFDLFHKTDTYNVALKQKQ